MDTSCNQKAESVREALLCVTTCSASTVQTLEQLLRPEQSEGVRCINPKGDHVKEPGLENSAPAAKRIPRNNRRGAKTSVTVIREEDGSCLSSEQRFVLATQVANTALRTLGDAVQSPKVSRRKSGQLAHATQKASSTATKAVLPPSSSTSSTSSASQQSAPQPLKTRCLNKVPKMPGKATVSRRTSSMSSRSLRPDPGLFSVAECGRLAFAYLRSRSVQRIAPKDAPPLQLENGVIALVRKMVVLGLDDMALKELRTLKKRLLGQGTNNEDKHAIKAGNSRGTTSAAPKEKESLCSLLHFPWASFNTSVLPLIIDHQMLVLKIIASRHRATVIQEALQYLELSCASAPANLILKQAVDIDAEGKVARQLENLAQLLLSICPSVSTGVDSVATNSKVHAPPDVVLRIQSLAFQVRLIWWKLSGHKGDSEQELLEPFSKCLSAFFRRSTLPPYARYETATETFGIFTSSVDGQCGLAGANASAKNMRAEMCQVLSKLAQQASATTEAMNWMIRSLELLSTSSASETKLAASKTRLAALTLDLHVLPSSVKVEKHGLVTEVVKMLEGSLKGDSVQLDILLTEVMSLRRAATKCLSQSQDQWADGCEGGEGAHTEFNQLKSTCQSVVYASVRFALRYIGSAPATEASKAIRARHDQRRSFVAKVVQGCVESVAMSCKASIADRSARWDTLDAMLQHCQMLLTRLEDGSYGAAKQATDVSAAVQSPFVKISNAYWAYYRHIKDTAGGSHAADIAKVLRRSISALQPRSSQEQQDGLLAVKWQRLGTYLASNGKGSEAKEALRQAIYCCVQAGALREAAELAGSAFPVSICSNDGHVGMLCKSIGALCDVAHEDEDLLNLVSLDGLNIEEQAILLEYKLTFAVEKAEKKTAHPSLNEVQSAVRELLRIYTPSDYPIRRLRVLTVGSRLMNNEQRQFYRDIASLTEAYDEAQKIQNLGRDSGLVRYLEHLRASLYACCGLGENVSSVDMLKNAVRTWADLVNSTEDWASLQNRVDDVQTWIRSLSKVIEYLDMLALDPIRIPTMTLLIKVLELQRAADTTLLVMSITGLGLAYLRMGYSGRAGILLARARKISSQSHPCSEADIRWHLAYAEYLLAVGDPLKGEQFMVTAKGMAQSAAVLTHLEKPQVSLSQRPRYRLIADASCVQALLELEHGTLQSALLHAKHCVKLNQQVWANLEKKGFTKVKAARWHDSDTEMEPLNEGVDAMSLETQVVSVTPSESHPALTGSLYWSLVPPLFRGLSLLSQIYARLGMLQEAVYYIGQAQQIAEVAKASPFLVESLLDLSGYLTGSGNLTDAERRLEEAETCNKGFERSKHKGAYHYSLGYLHQSRGDHVHELSDFERAEAVIRSLTSSSYVQELDEMSSPADCLNAQMSKLSVQGRSPTRKVHPSQTAKKSSIKRRPKPAILACRPKITMTPSATIEECPSLLGFQGTIIRRKARTMLLQGKLDEVTDLLAQAQDFQYGQEGRIDQQFVVVRKLLYESTKAMTGDTVLGLIADSTISLPAITRDRRKTNSTTRVSRSALLSPPSKSPVKTSPAKRNKSKSAVRASFQELLQQAQRILLDIQTMSIPLCSTAMVCQIGKLLAQVTMLLSAADVSRNRQFVHPLMASYSLELASNYALHQTVISTGVEKRPTTPGDLLKWPAAHPSTQPDLFDANIFQKAFIDIIPSTWTAVSINVSESREELYMARYQTGQSPFILRLPLGRHNSRDENEDIFGFDQGKAELLDIIDLSNVSTQKAVDIDVKGAKTEWWAAREALDGRMRDLLSNVESIWLGGFRGIFSQHLRQPELLARFQSSFQMIMNKHLPSRRKQGRRSKAVPSKLQLDARILELFVGLGDATDEGLDLSEPLMDLLYFVVDILQFNGERNAYDEIDFDAMVPETIDALRSYHAAAAWSSPSGAAPQHTILILDKQVHCIPWESLPCLRGLSVSRLPSLGALRQRILGMRRASRTAVSHGNQRQEERVEVGCDTGAYILNPGGDLAHTESVFAPRLSALDNSKSSSLQSSQWEGVTSQAPTSQLLTSYLTSKDIFLYFGHGSGAQYIRRRDVRKLDKCSPVVCLFGCSSAVLKEEGCWEPWGMVASYLTAGWRDMGGPVDEQDDHGCLEKEEEEEEGDEGEAEMKEGQGGTAAVLGMLWDVTDKDCDRFAEKALTEWGLFPPSSSSSLASTTSAIERGTQPKTPARKGKAKKGDATAAGAAVKETTMPKHSEERVQTQKGKISLSEAVARGRDACYLKYLNGAAAVVYGVPVYLK